jgi:PAS domain S-box-containing protein
MVIRRSRMNRLQWQLPVAIAILLLTVSSAVVGLAYLESRRGAESAARARLSSIAGQLTDMLEQSAASLRVQTAATAGSPQVVGLLTGAATGEEARARFAPGLRPTGQVFAIEVWRADGSRVFDMTAEGAPAAVEAPNTFPAWAQPDAAVFSMPFTGGGVASFSIAAPVTSSNALQGYALIRRRLVSPSSSTNLIEQLIGSGSRVLIGGDQSGWADLLHREAPALTEVIRPDANGVYWTGGEGDRWLGVTTGIDGTPWRLRAEFPEAVVTALPHELLRNIIGVALLVTGVGTFGGWLISRRLTKPLRALTDAAVIIAEGTGNPKVPFTRADEIGMLTGAFNIMVDKVAEARRDLEDRVEERTGELEAALDRLVTSEELFRNIAATAPVAVVVADTEGTIRFMNKAGERMFGHSEPGLVGQPLTKLMPPRFHRAHNAGMRRFIQHGTPGLVGRSAELTGLRANGDEFAIELSLSSWQERGSPMFAGIIRDLSESKTAEQTLRDYATRLENSNRELEAFSYTISHDLRAPLRSIDGFTEALLTDCGHMLDAQGTGYMTRVRNAVKRMDMLIDDLLELARVSRVEVDAREVSLSTLARRVVQDLRDRAPDRRVDVQIQDGLMAHGDPKLLALVLQNLLDNAWKFTSTRAHAIIEFRADPAGAPNTFVVRDNGVGFEMADASKIFDIFQRLHSMDQFPGTGVGLAIVHRIITRHGGRFWAEAKPDAGAAFFFTLGAGA